jgi:four helix bundle protein
MTSQMRRAAISVPSNIAEGLTRKTNKDKLHFLNIAQSSLSEIDTQLEISMNLSSIEEVKFSDIEKRLVEVQMLLSGLSRSLS